MSLMIVNLILFIFLSTIFIKVVVAPICKEPLFYWKKKDL